MIKRHHVIAIVFIILGAAGLCYVIWYFTQSSQQSPQSVQAAPQDGNQIYVSASQDYTRAIQVKKGQRLVLTATGAEPNPGDDSTLSG